MGFYKVTSLALLIALLSYPPPISSLTPSVSQNIEVEMVEVNSSLISKPAMISSSSHTEETHKDKSKSEE